MPGPSSPPATVKPKLARRQYLVERGFQLRYTTLLAVVGAFASGVFGLLVLFLERSMRAGLRLPPDLVQALAEKERTLTWLIVALTLLMAGTLAIFGLLLTHRVAGPVYVLNHYVGVLARGQYPRLRPLRKHDELQGLFDSFGRALDSLRKREAEEAELLEQVLRTVSPALSSPEGQQLLQRLEAVKDRKRDATDVAERSGSGKSAA